MWRLLSFVLGDKIGGLGYSVEEMELIFVYHVCSLSIHARVTASTYPADIKRCDGC